MFRFSGRLGIAMVFGMAGGIASAQMFNAPPPPPPVAADVILEGGKIYTPTGWATSLAIGKGVILAVGDAAAVQPHRGPRTQVIPLNGHTVLPGLHDMHVHPTGAGLSAMECQLPHGSSPKQILQITAGCVKVHKKGEWITGRAYEAASFGTTPPNKSMLDGVAPDNPVLYTDISGHSTWANSMALKLAGIAKDTPNPPNGIIERDNSGEATGLLRESASRLVGALVPPASREKSAKALKWALDTMLAQGITAFDDAFVFEPTAQAYADLADRGDLHQRVRGCLNYREEGLIARRSLYARDRFSPSCIKVVLDGVPTDSHTAAMLDEYVPMAGRNDQGREKGLLMVPPEDLKSLLIRFDSMGMTVKFHAAGDAAVREGLDAITAAREAHGFSGLLHDVAHNSFVNMSDIRRARSIGAVFEFSPYIWFESPIIADIRKAVGNERMKRWIPVKDALDAGALVVPGSDWAVVPTVNPWVAIETLVTRQVPGGIGAPLGAAEQISLKQAIDLFTINSARQMYQADHLGSLERGKLADLVVIDRNIFEVPITTVHDTKVLFTYINGEVVYESGHPVASAPAP